MLERYENKTGVRPLVVSGRRDFQYSQAVYGRFQGGHCTGATLSYHLGVHESDENSDCVESDSAQRVLAASADRFQGQYESMYRDDQVAARNDLYRQAGLCLNYKGYLKNRRELADFVLAQEEPGRYVAVIRDRNETHDVGITVLSTGQHEVFDANRGIRVTTSSSGFAEDMAEQVQPKGGGDASSPIFWKWVGAGTAVYGIKPK
jgi:hypothetical protein